MASNVDRLQRWYASQCDGDWEHSYGVRLETLDNPGWRIEVDLADTELQDVTFEVQQRGDSGDDSDWLFCKREGAKFIGAGGSGNLDELLGIFVQWAESHAPAEA